MTDRLDSLDVFRGITVAAMILVNNPGSWSYVYSPLLHAPWNGCTPTDLIFPFFLFIVGVSVHFAYKDKKPFGLSKEVSIKIVRRSFIIIAIGILLALFPSFNFDIVRIPGVLQRIGVVFCLVSFIYMKTEWLFQIRLTVALLVGYYILMTLVPVPGIGYATLDPETNLGAWIDRALLEGHLWSQSKTWDPEGLLSTIPAIATAMLGVLAGQLFRYTNEPAKRTVWLFLIGAILTVAGLGWSLVFPINKSLWTSSYVLYSGGIAFQFLASCYWLVDVVNVKSWSRPFIYYGTNALFVFVLSGVIAKILIRTKIENRSVWSIIYNDLYAYWLPPKFASLCFAITLIVLFYFLLRWMYKKKIFIKI